MPGDGWKTALLCLFKKKKARNLDFYVRFPHLKILIQMPLKPTASQNDCTCQLSLARGPPACDLYYHFATSSEAELANFSCEQLNSK